MDDAQVTASRLLRSGSPRADVRDRLIRMGVSRRQAYRLIDRVLECEQRGGHGCAK
jgi:hypothetical protein